MAATALLPVTGAHPRAVPHAVLAAVLLAAALLVVGGRPARARLRVLNAPAPHAAQATPVRPLRAPFVAVGALAVGVFGAVVGGAVPGIVLAAATAGVGGYVAHRGGARPGPVQEQAGELAGSWELLAVCLESGLPVAAAVSAAAEPLDGSVGALLRRVSGLLELGADPAGAWQGAEEVPTLATFARAAGRSAGTGAALAQVARAEAARIRAELLDSAQSKAQRAAVLVAGPLGLCFLPAFLVLGIAPVVIGLASEALAQW
ncbi:type II secretion system F family protein [Pseudonocardia nigra]|uniref:type II secretion system F family protein n=1 Tax=Pseudonocardia nigra TaxID=1921578 RepID=UPI0027E2E129|nr:type II secretion system F family protein [Pseudonocardia nigra]